MQMELVEFFFSFTYSASYVVALPRHDLALVIPFQNLKIITIFTRNFPFSQRGKFTLASNAMVHVL